MLFCIAVQNLIVNLRRRSRGDTAKRYKSHEKGNAVRLYTHITWGNIMPYILHELRGSNISHYELAEHITIGRSTSNQVVIDDATVSAHHAIIEKTETGYQIRDLDSTNGVYVNGKRLTVSPIQAADNIVIGTHNLRVVDTLPNELEKTVRIKKSWIPGIYYTDR